DVPSYDDFNGATEYFNGSPVIVAAVEDGVASVYESDNFITPGPGNDVVVLGTLPEESSNDTTESSNDTIIYVGYDNGIDTIVNFVVGANEAGPAFAGQVVEEEAPGVDYLDFTSYGAAELYVGDLTAQELALTAIDPDALTPAIDEDLYVLLIENATNPGEYKATLWEAVDGVDGYGSITSYNTLATEGDDDLIGVIGVLDFGDTVAFAGENFVGFGGASQIDG
ncbi:MAG: hypothetical protein GX751_07340, partial [Desulfuromonadaceae bacterium]|nr:hypothetical protein [Desulfuromonadaceae bacterium]